MAVLAQGFTKVQLDTATSGGPTFTDIPGVLTVSGGGQPPNRIDATDFDTAPGTKEYISGPRDQSPFSFDMHYEQGNTVQEALFTAEAANTPKTFRIKLGNGAGAKGLTFESVPALSLSAPVDGKVTYSVSLEPLAAAAREDASA